MHGFAMADLVAQFTLIEGRIVIELDYIAAARDRLNDMTPLQLAAIHEAQRRDAEAEERISIAARRFHVLADVNEIDLAVAVAQEARAR